MYKYDLSSDYIVNNILYILLLVICTSHTSHDIINHANTNTNRRGDDLNTKADNLQDVNVHKAQSSGSEYPE